MRSLQHLWDLCLIWSADFQRIRFPGSGYHIDHLYLIINILALSSQAVTEYGIELLLIEIINHSDFSITLVEASEKKEENWQRNPNSGQMGKRQQKCSARCFQTVWICERTETFTFQKG